MRGGTFFKKDVTSLIKIESPLFIGLLTIPLLLFLFLLLKSKSSENVETIKNFPLIIYFLLCCQLQRKKSNCQA
jgi:hypothetical protein